MQKEKAHPTLSPISLVHTHPIFKAGQCALSPSKGTVVDASSKFRIFRSWLALTHKRAFSGHYPHWFKEPCYHIHNWFISWEACSWKDQINPGFERRWTWGHSLQNKGWGL